MHPGFMGWLRRQHAEYRASGHGDHAEHPRGEWGNRCGGGQHGWRHAAHGFDEHGTGFGVRRPLRFLAHKLELSDDQVGQLAAILDRLKTERAQADGPCARGMLKVVPGASGSPKTQSSDLSSSLHSSAAHSAP